MCRANAEATGAMTVWSRPREGRDRNRNGRASALYLLQSRSGHCARRWRAETVTRVQRVVCESAK
jgi:hypothetical protein